MSSLLTADPPGNVNYFEMANNLRTLKVRPSATAYLPCLRFRTSIQHIHGGMLMVH